MSARLQAVSATEGACLALIRAEHRRLDEHLRDYAVLVGVKAATTDRQGLIACIGVYLQTLMTLKEELLYPPVEPLVGAALIASLRSDHHRMERGLQALAAGVCVGDDVATDLQMAQLTDVIRAHIALEEERLFPTAEAVDSDELGETMALRRAELLLAIRRGLTLDPFPLNAIRRPH